MLDAHRHGESIAIEASVPADAFKNAKLVEEIVMKWAAEHPEPIYPTWAEYLETLGLYNENVGVMVDNLENTKISPEMAQKLEIEPKEG